MNLKDQHRDSVWAVAFSVDGKSLASGDGAGTVILWDAASGKARHTLKSKHAIFAVAFAPDGKTLVAGGEDNTATLWDVDSGKARHTLKTERPIQSLAGSARLTPILRPASVLCDRLAVDRKLAHRHCPAV